VWVGPRLGDGQTGVVVRISQWGWGDAAFEESTRVDTGGPDQT
jgi:hypothetical protein